MSAKFAGVRVGIWGAGREGLAAAEWFLARGADVLVVDERADSRPEGLAEQAKFTAGPQALEQLADCATVCVSPGVPGVHPVRAELRAQGIDLTSVTDQWLREQGARTIGVTGTKGKSTTTTLIAALLQAAGADAQLGGNIGIPLAGLRADAEVTVAELSSYQCASLTVSPRLAVVTSLYEDHLPWHGSREQYWLDKARVWSEGAQLLVTVPQVLEVAERIPAPLPASVLQLTEAFASRLAQIELPGSLAFAQNRRNFELAVTVAEAWLERSLTSAEIADGVRRFEPLPHRLEVVHESNGITWIDDTLSTIPQSVAAALRSVPGEIILIVGGDERGIDYGEILPPLLEREPAPQVYTIPTNGRRIAAGYRQAHPELVIDFESLEDAVAHAAAHAALGTAVLLSPGAPSFDFYRDFADKSRAFLAAVQRHAG